VVALGLIEEGLMSREKTVARVLVVDDDESMRELVRHLLEAAGHEAWTATGGRAALTLAKERAFDIALVDIIMPDIDGIETIEKLRKISPNTRICAMSGSSSNSAGYLETVLALGADGALEKPFDKHDLEVTVAELLRRV